MKMTPKIEKEIKRWIKALRSGNYNQTKHRLNDENGYCCLGVACDLFIPKHKQHLINGCLIGAVPESQQFSPEWLRNIDADFKSKTKEYLTTLNDATLNANWSFSFNEIADLLELVYIHKMLG